MLDFSWTVTHLFLGGGTDTGQRRSKRSKPWLNASGINARGRLRRFSIWREGESFCIYDLQTYVLRRAEYYLLATKENVRKELEYEFHLRNVTIERVKFQQLPGYS
jgi:hypothetical protein